MAHILLIEPDRLLAEVYQSALRQAGHRVVWAADAQTAIAAADRQTPELIILELQLAEHNGFEFLYELRSYRDWQTVPVIIQSLVPQHEFGESAVLWQQLAVSAYLYKPRTSLQQLLRAVDLQLAVSANQLSA